MKFLIDAQLPPAVALWLREAGYQAEHVEDAGMRASNDGAIWAYALRTGVIILTKDEDFASRSAQSADAPLIVWLRVGNTTNRALRAWLELRLPGIVLLISRGSRLVEVV